MATRKQGRPPRRTSRPRRRVRSASARFANLPKSTRRELGEQAAKGRRRGGEPGRALEDRNREQLYEIAKKNEIPGRSKMGKWDLIKAIRRAR